MNGIWAYVIDGFAFVVPAFSVLRYGWLGIPAGFFAAWLLPLVSSHLRGVGKETVEYEFYWTMFGWTLALAYCLALWGVRGLFRLILCFWRRRVSR